MCIFVSVETERKKKEIKRQRNETLTRGGGIEKGKQFRTIKMKVPNISARNSLRRGRRRRLNDLRSSIIHPDIVYGKTDTPL